jgi:hypothetical protein
MKGKCFFAFVLLTAVMVPSVEAQVGSSGCMIDSFGFRWSLTVTSLVGCVRTYTGTVELGDPGGPWTVTGSSNDCNRSIMLRADNPPPDGDPGCDHGDGYVDWFAYSGVIYFFNGRTWFLSGTWANACTFNGTWEGRARLGPCPAPLDAPPVEGVTPASSLDAAASAPVSDLETSPDGYALAPSAPNPFSRETSISFALPEAAQVDLRVYDVLGRVVATLVDEERGAGTHTVAFDASSLPAGTYVYRMEAGSYSEARQMMVVK